MKRDYRDAMIEKIRSKQAVSEVIGVVLLLGITISLFAVLNFYVFHFSFDSSTPSVNLIGTINKEDNLISIEHNGGESLEGNIEITIRIGSVTNQSSISEILGHTNADWTLNSQKDDKNPDKWDFGETVQFNFTDIDITGQYIQATVVDPISNIILLSVVLQQ